MPVSLGSHFRRLTDGSQMEHQIAIRIFHFLDKDCRIAAWNRIGDDWSDQIERDIVDAESSDEVCDIADMFLMWFSGEDALE